jgi:hypothetical protein
VPPSIEAVVRLLLFVRRPYSLEGDEAVRWMQEHAASLTTMLEVDRIDLTRLQAPPLRGGTDWQWMIEMHCADGEAAIRASRDRCCRELVADLRLLGMQPSLVVADGTEALAG